MNRELMKKVIAYLNLIRTVPLMIAYILSDNKDKIYEDIKRNEYFIPFKKKSGIIALSYLLCLKHEFRNVFFYRLKRNFVSSRLLSLLYRPIKSLEIDGDINSGLTIYHGHSCIISVNRAGKNLSVWQNVTIGRRPRKDNEIDKPTIGENVNIYTGAIVVGNISIGNNVSIGAGAVVLRDVPDNCVVVGNPARIVKRNGLKVNEKL